MHRISYKNEGLISLQTTTHRSSPRMREISRDPNKRVSGQSVARRAERLWAHAAAPGGHERPGDGHTDAGHRRRVHRQQGPDGRDPPTQGSRWKPHGVLARPPDAGDRSTDEEAVHGDRPEEL